MRFDPEVLTLCVQAMVGILQGKARGGEEESVLMHDLKPFRILISLLDKPELGTVHYYIHQINATHIIHVTVTHRIEHKQHFGHSDPHVTTVPLSEGNTIAKRFTADN